MAHDCTWPQIDVRLDTDVRLGKSLAVVFARVWVDTSGHAVRCGGVSPAISSLESRRSSWLTVRPAQRARICGWYLREPPPAVPTTTCVRCNGLTLLYIGIAPPCLRSGLHRPGERQRRSLQMNNDLKFSAVVLLDRTVCRRTLMGETPSRGLAGVGPVVVHPIAANQDSPASLISHCECFTGLVSSRVACSDRDDVRSRLQSDRAGTPAGRA